MEILRIFYVPYINKKFAKLVHTLLASLIFMNIQAFHCHPPIPLVLPTSPLPLPPFPHPTHPTLPPSCLTHTNLDIGCITHSAMHYSAPHAPDVSLINIDDTSNPSPSPYPPGAPNLPFDPPHIPPIPPYPHHVSPTQA